MSTPDYFTSDPDWEAFATKNDIPLPSATPQQPSAPVDFTQLDFASIREYEAISNTQWAESHPIEEVGYTVKSATVRARDGADINLKVSFPLSNRLDTKGKDKISLPILLVTHGGGWVQGNHTSEELWLLYPLYERFDLVIVSVEYRLAPENRFPIWIEDSEDVLDALLDSPERILGLNANIKVDLNQLILAGSSSGAGISAALSQICRDKGIPVNGVVLNVPMLCDPRHFPVAEYGPSEESLRSYTQCMDIFMGSTGLLAVWNLIHPEPASGLSSKASPLLGDVNGLPRHLIFVSGQDPLRDEGIAYARKLEERNVPVTLNVYKVKKYGPRDGNSLRKLMVCRLIAKESDVHARMNLEGTQALIDHRGDIELAAMVTIADSEGRLPAHWALIGTYDRREEKDNTDDIISRILTIVKTLLDVKLATVNPRDESGTTAFHYALQIRIEYREVFQDIEVLLDANPSVDTLNSNHRGTTSLGDVMRSCKTYGGTLEKQQA
ncbi:unnamed protein product [Penicillium crustosum]